MASTVEQSFLSLANQLLETGLKSSILEQLLSFRNTLVEHVLGGGIVAISNSRYTNRCNDMLRFEKVK